MKLEKQSFLNTDINNITTKELLEIIDESIQKEKPLFVVPINVDVVMRIEQDAYLRKIVKSADVVVADGKPLLWIAKYFKQPLKEKISGSDLVPLLCEESAKKGYTIFILGGKEGIAKRAKHKLEKQYKDIRVVGTYAPPFGFEKNQKELEYINNMITERNPDILITCFGCPKQEKFIYENRDKYSARISLCAGATVDFLAGNVKRAPRWMSEHGFEWLYRFFQEPKRLFKRYFIDDVKILGLIRKYKR